MKPFRRSRTDRAQGAHLPPRNVYIVFGAIAVLVGLASVAFADVDWVDRFGPNLATEALGILLTLIFVHRFLDRQERVRRLRGSIGALRKSARALTALAQTWGDLIKGGYARTASHPPGDLDALFAPHVGENLAHVHPLAERPIGQGERERWIELAYRTLVGAQQNLRDIIMAYGTSLEPAYVEVLDELVDDPFPEVLGELAADPALDARRWRIRLNATRALREAHFAKLVHAIALHNEIARDAATVRSRRSAPRTGSIGVELPLDYDLRVRFAVDDGWWRSEPRPGSLAG